MEILERLRCFYENADCDECTLDVRHAIEELERLCAERRWIPVEERLPEEGEVVLLYYGGDTDPIAVGKYLGLGGVTHWMPLPEPPAA
jgi:hypothetical protein